MPTNARTRLTECEHCGTPFTPKADERFCCHGCQYVSQMLHEGGLERFYELKGRQALPPVGSQVFETTESEWLEVLQTQSETEGDPRFSNAELGIEGISCIGCVWLIEACFRQLPGALDIRIDPREGLLNLRWQSGVFRLDQFARELHKVGYRLRPSTLQSGNRNSSRQLVNRIGLCAFFLMNTMLFTLPGYLGMGGEFFLAPLFQLLGAGFATLSLVVGGGYFINRAVQALRTRVLHIDLPIAIGLLAAYTGSLLGWASGYTNLIYFDFVATFVFLMLVGRWLQEVALEQNRARMQKQDFSPREVTLSGGPRDGERIPVAEVHTGQVFTVAPGGLNPVASDLLETEASLSLEWINGESEPVEWPAERILPAGSINIGLQPIRVRAREAWTDSLLAQLLQRPPNDFEDRKLQTILKCYIATVLAVAVLGGLAWLAASGDLLKSTQVLISVLVVSCPCALGVALPMCEELAIARLRRYGLFIKTPEIWERLQRVKTVVFDKTGTLTMDVPRLKDESGIRDMDPIAGEALYHLVRDNAHPVARSLRETLLAYHPVLQKTESAAQALDETVGQGVSWKDRGGNLWTLGKPAWQAKNGAQPAHAHTVLRQNGLLITSFEFEEDVRDDAVHVVQYLHQHGLETAILSGDAPERVQRIGQELSLPEDAVLAQCSPTDKSDWIRSKAPGRALMIGDGANDSLAFDHAVCRGTPVVDRSILEAASDFFFFGRSLRCLPELFETTRKRRRTVLMIFSTAVCYNLIAVSLCLAGLMHPLLAAILMPISSIVTLLLAWMGLGKRTSSHR